MATIAEITAKFSADLTDFNAGVGTASNKVSSFEKTTKKSSAIISKGMSDVGRAAVVAANAFGGPFADAVNTGSQLALSFGKSLLGPAGVVAGLVLAGSAIVAYVLKQNAASKAALDAEIKTRALAGTYAGLEARAKAAGEAVTKAAEAEAAALIKIEKAKAEIAKPFSVGLFNFAQLDPKGTPAKDLAEGEQELAAARQAKENSQLSNTISQLDLVSAQYDATIRKLNTDIENGGSQLEFYTGSLDAAKAAKQGALSVEVDNASAVREYNDLITESTNRLNVYKKTVEAATAAAPTFSAAMTAALANVQAFTVQLANSVIQLSETFSSGLGNAIAQVIVYGASLAEALTSVLKQVAAAAIQTLVKLAVQAIIFAAIGKAILADEAGDKLGTAALSAGAFAYASAIETQGLIGLGTGAGFAAAAIAGAVAAGSTGFAVGKGVGSAFLAAKGAVVSGPTFAMIGEGRSPTEYVLPQSRLDQVLDGAGGGGYRVSTYLDSRVIAEAVGRQLPRVLELYGVRT